MTEPFPSVFAVTLHVVIRSSAKTPRRATQRSRHIRARLRRHARRVRVRALGIAENDERIARARVLAALAPRSRRSSGFVVDGVDVDVRERDDLWRRI